MGLLLWCICATAILLILLWFVLRKKTENRKNSYQITCLLEQYIVIAQQILDQYNLIFDKGNTETEEIFALVSEEKIENLLNTFVQVDIQIRLLMQKQNRRIKAGIQKFLCIEGNLRYVSRGDLKEFLQKAPGQAEIIKSLLP